MSAVFYRTPSKSYPVAVRGQGVYIWDASGTRYLDACSGALVANIGHGRDEVASAIAEQASRLGFVHGSQFTNEPLEHLSERLTGLAPAGTRWLFFPTSGGSEATESAIKLARQYHVERGEPGRYRIVSRWTSYHGASMGALAASGLKGRRELYEPLIPAGAYPKIAKPDPRRDGREDAAQLETSLLALGPESVAAFIAEPIVGAADPALAPAAGYYEEIRRICTKYGILFLADEVMCGLGRAGRRFAIEYWDALPDVIVVGKGLAAGYAPLAGILVAQPVHDAIKEGSGAFRHGYTYAGHPPSLAAGAKVLEIVQRERLVERSAETGARLLRGLEQLRAKHPFVVEVRGHGLMAGLVLGDPATGEPFPEPGAAARVGRLAFERGLILYPGSGAFDGVRGDHLLIGPPLSIQDQELDELLGLLASVLSDASARRLA